MIKKPIKQAQPEKDQQIHQDQGNQLTKQPRATQKPNSTTELTCDCGNKYTIRTDAPGWSAAWEQCK